MGLFDKLAKVVFRSVGNMEHIVSKKVEGEYREASRNFNINDDDSVSRYREAAEKLNEFSKTKKELDTKKAMLQYELDMKSEDFQKRRWAAYELKEKLEKSESEIRHLYNMAENYNPYKQKNSDNFIEYLIVACSLGCILVDALRSKSVKPHNNSIRESLYEDFFDEEIDPDLEYEDLLIDVFFNRKDDPVYKDWIKQQEETINKVKAGQIELRSNDAKGKFGEMLVDQDMRERGYVRISDGMITKFSDKGHQGIDGIYCNIFKRPQYVIVEAKYNTSKLSATKQGYRQTSLEWLVGEEIGDIDRVYNDVKGETSVDLGMELFESLNADDGNVKVYMAHISPEQTVNYSEMDKDGYEKRKHVDSF